MIKQKIISYFPCYTNKEVYRHETSRDRSCVETVLFGGSHNTDPEQNITNRLKPLFTVLFFLPFKRKR